LCNQIKLANSSQFNVFIRFCLLPIKTTIHVDAILLTTWLHEPSSSSVHQNHHHHRRSSLKKIRFWCQCNHLRTSNDLMTWCLCNVVFWLCNDLLTSNIDLWYNANVCLFIITMSVLLFPTIVCIKDQIDICYENSRTYLMVFSLIWWSKWWIRI